MIFGDLMGLKLPDIRLTGEEKPRKNLTQETCPDRESNSGPLRGKRAWYHLLHSGGPLGNTLISFWDINYSSSLGFFRKQYIKYIIIIIIIIIMSFLLRDRSFTAHKGTKVAVLSKGRFSTANSGTKVAVLPGKNRCGSFPLLSAIKIYQYYYMSTMGRRLIGIFGSLIWWKTLMELILTPVVNISEVRRAQLAKSTLLTSSLVPLGSFQFF